MIVGGSVARGRQQTHPPCKGGLPLRGGAAHNQTAETRSTMATMTTEVETPARLVLAMSLRARAENSALRATILREMAEQMERLSTALNQHADELEALRDAGIGSADWLNGFRAAMEDVAAHLVDSDTKVMTSVTGQD